MGLLLLNRKQTKLSSHLSLIAIKNFSVLALKKIEQEHSVVLFFCLCIFLYEIHEIKKRITFLCKLEQKI